METPLPYVVDNEAHKLGEVLNNLLSGHAGKSLDVATAYFNVPGFVLLRKGLLALRSFRLLLGDEPADGEDLGLRPRAAHALRHELEEQPYTRDQLRAVEDLIAFLRRPNVAIRAYQNGFLHAKAYLFYGDSPLTGWDRFQPVAAVVGSSNFTASGLTSNRELNILHKAVMDEGDLKDDLPQSIWPDRLPAASNLVVREQQAFWKSTVGARAIADLDAWFERQWSAAIDYKDQLIELLDSSKFGERQYSPYDVYKKALFEYFRDDLQAEPEPVAVRSAVELSEFQDDAVRKARKILARYDGVLIGDSVGLGKTWIGKKLLEDFAYHLRHKAIVVCPASLRDLWLDELREATIPAVVVSQEELGQADFDSAPYADTDLLLIDESHNFRNRATQRYENLERLVSQNGGRGRDGQPKKLILMTATPINNDVFDLYNQVNLITRGDRGYFAAAGIGDLQRYFHLARRNAGQDKPGTSLYNLLEEVAIRRTRPFIRRAYPHATIRGNPVHWPERRLRTVKYDLESTYGGIYDRIVDAIDNLRLAPYRLETYKKRGVHRDQFEEGRQEALAGIFKSRYLKRFESSVEAFRISVRRALQYMKTFESYLLEGKLLESTSFQRSMRYLAREDVEDDAIPSSLASSIDAGDEARGFLATLPTLDAGQYNLRHLHDALQQDIDALTEIWMEIKGLGPANDAKILKLKELLGGELRGRKALIFTYYKDTARYLYRELGDPKGSHWRATNGNPRIRRMDSGETTRDRLSLIEAFAPIANNRPELASTEKEIDVLISTDVLSEGQNLQDCGVVVNYDLHWNPTRMVQRAGRVDRLLSPHSTVWIFNMFPDEGLEQILRLVENLSRKISDIDRTGFLDASVLGELVHPQNFNTLRRIREEDDTVIEEQEQFFELVSNESLLHQLRALLDAGEQQALEALPDGIHSGLAREGIKGIFFYYTANLDHERRHFWVFYDLARDKFMDNRLQIANLISCSVDTPRVLGDVDIFAIQDKALDFIVSQSREREAVEAAPKLLDPIQQTMATLIRGFLNHPHVNRQHGRELIQGLSRPLPNVYVKTLKAIYQQYGETRDLDALLERLTELRLPALGTGSEAGRSRTAPNPSDLHLICFDYVWS